MSDYNEIHESSDHESTISQSPDTHYSEIKDNMEVATDNKQEKESKQSKESKESKEIDKINESNGDDNTTTNDSKTQDNDISITLGNNNNNDNDDNTDDTNERKDNHCETSDNSPPIVGINDNTSKIEERIIYISIKIKRISNVDTVGQTFRMKFHIIFNWIPSEKEISNYYEDRNKEDFDCENWKPSWYPQLEFPNMVEEHYKEWEKKPKLGAFRLLELKYADIKIDWFFRCKLMCDMTFAEGFELKNFPLDCQDLTCIIQERTTQEYKTKFLPELRKKNFCCVDPKYSAIDGWDLCNALVTLRKSKGGRTDQCYPQIEISLKLSRKWRVFAARIVLFIFFTTAMNLIAFSLSFDDDLGDRLGYIVTLLLTLVVFSDTIFSLVPDVPYFTFLEWYTLICYIYTIFILTQSSIAHYFKCDYMDTLSFWSFVGIFIVIHIIFLIFGKWKRSYELKKLSLTREDVEKHIEEKREKLSVKYTQKLLDDLRNGIAQHDTKHEFWAINYIQ